MELGITSWRRLASAFEYSKFGGRQLMIKPRTTFDTGARYRFKAGDTPAALRFNAYGWKVSTASYCGS